MERHAESWSGALRGSDLMPPMHCNVLGDARIGNAPQYRPVDPFLVSRPGRARGRGRRAATRRERIADQEVGGGDPGRREVCPIALLMSLLRFSGSETSITTRW